MRAIRMIFLIPLLAVVFLGAGCQAVGTGLKVVVTPVAVVRDVVDVPLTGIASFINTGAESTRSSLGRPSAGVGWGLGGPTAGVGLDLSYIVGKAFAYTIGGVDYILCRSLWPNPPQGVTPFKPRGESWGSHLFPNTETLWGNHLKADSNWRMRLSPPPVPDPTAPAPPAPSGGP